jgi:Holliday junction resolvasome RuvABC endonuclease subunit
MSNLLALDQASITTGYAVFKDGVLVAYNKFTFEDEIGDRLVKIRKKVISLIEEYNIDEVAFEDIQMQSNVANNVQTFKVLSEVFGVIQELVTELGIRYTIVPSQTWKSTLSIKGRTRPEQKRNAQAYVLDKYEVKAVQDVCDAICIGTHVLHKGGTAATIPSSNEGFDWSD